VACPVLHRIALAVVSGGCGIRVAGSFAKQGCDQDILGSLDSRVGMGTCCPQPGEFTSDRFRYLHYTGSVHLQYRGVEEEADLWKSTSVTRRLSSPAEVPSSPGGPRPWPC
jgi:hypothetical protein